jgi:hypothetical protein
MSRTSKSFAPSLVLGLASLGFVSVGVATGWLPSVASAEEPKPGERPRLQLAIETPTADALVGDPGGMAFIAGKALAHYGEFETFDIVFVIDQSDSTSAPSGADIDGDGEVGRRKGESYLSILGRLLPLPITDQGDSVLAAELAAVSSMLDQLDPRTTRVGIIAFSGDTDPLTSDAQVFTPLTTDYDKVRKGLEEIRDIGPTGRTNMLQGVQVGTVELIGSQSALSTKRLGARRIMLFLTDGRPTLPLDASTHQNRRLAISAAAKASQHAIRIDTFAVGEEALSEPIVTVEMARVTEGVFTPVMNPKDLPAVFEQVNFSEIDKLEIKNLTTKQDADYTLRSADGTFSALVPMVEGENTVEVYARSSDGTEGKQRVKLRFLPGAEVQPLSPALLSARNRLMESRLLDLKQRRVAIQTARDEQTREGLKEEIDRTREEYERKVRIETREEREREAKQGGEKDPKSPE